MTDSANQTPLAGEPPQESIVFDRAADYYDATRGFPPGVDAQVAAFIAQVADITADHRVLEIGVGTGRIAVPLAAHTGPYVGVDLSTGMLAHMQAKQQTSERRVHPVQGDVMQLPVASGSIDRTVAVHILHLIPDPLRALAELKRVLKPGGLALHCWNDKQDDSMEKLREVWNEMLDQRAPKDTRWKIAQTIFPDHGWTRVGEPHRFEYEVESTPAATADRFRKRQMSSTWLLPDDVWQSAVEAIDAVLREHFPDPEQPIRGRTAFVVEVFAPPQ